MPLKAGGIAPSLNPSKAITQYTHDVWQTQHGLPQNYVADILQTRDGYLWLCTQEGLVRFDGVHFTLVPIGNTKNKNILSLLEDRQGVLWIGTSAGLVHFKGGKFKTYTVEDGFPENAVECIYQDRQGNVWVATNGAGLAQLKDGRFKIYTVKEGLSSNFIKSVREDSKGNLLIGTYGGGLNRLTNGRFTAYTTKEGLSNDFILNLWPDRKGNLWIATRNGLNCFRDERFTVYTTADGLSHNFIRRIYEDRNGALWIGTASGLTRLSNGVFTTSTGIEELSEDAVRSIYEDREGSLWIGTSSQGLNRLKEEKFTTFSASEGLSNNQVRSIFEDREGNLWMGTYGGGLNRLKDGKFTTYTAKDGLSSDLVLSVYGDREGSVWIGASSGGLSRLQNGKFRRYTTKDGLSNEVVTSMFQDRQGNLWMGTDGGGLNRYRDGKFTAYTSKDGLANDIIRCVYEDRHGNLWIGTSKGLSKLKDGKFTTYTTENGLASDFVLSFLEDREGNFWIGTYAGLNLYKDGQFVTYDSDHGLLDNVVLALFEDPAGYLWISCHKGVFRLRKKELYDLATGKIAAVTSVGYGLADGMKSNECNGGTQPSSWQASDGKIWFSTMKGVAVIDPANVRRNTLVPPVLVESLIADGKKIDLAEQKQLEPGKNKLEFHYTALSFRAPKMVRFRYRLEGFDEDWVEAGERRVAYYTNLPPGNYRFRVKAANNDGVWNEQGASLEFYLKPHFYQTYFFYLLCLIAAVSTGVGIARFRIRQLEQREKELSHLVEERTKQLEEANQRLELLATLDGLTGIANRRRFKEFLDQQWDHCRRYGVPLSLIMIDIDCFKLYNDSLGHQAGDACLKQVAATLSKVVGRPDDLAARYGGEEFAIILGRTDAEGALCVGEKVSASVAAEKIPHPKSSVSSYVTLSVGIATVIPSSDSSPDALIETADQGLYKAKKEGRNQIKCLDLTAKAQRAQRGAVRVVS